MKSSLYTCIQDIQNGDREQALALLEKFSPLLKSAQEICILHAIRGCAAGFSMFLTCVCQEFTTRQVDHEHRWCYY